MVFSKPQWDLDFMFEIKLLERWLSYRNWQAIQIKATFVSTAKLLPVNCVVVFHYIDAFTPCP